MGKFKDASNPVKQNKPGNSFSTDEIQSKQNGLQPQKPKERGGDAIIKPKPDQRMKTFSRDTEENIPISNQDPW